MVDLLLYVLLLALFALAVLAAYWVMRNHLGIESPMTAIFGARPERRLAVVEHASVDGRRRLVLVRRDDVEHLIMTGGPVDVVIETGIDERKSGAAPLARQSEGASEREPAAAAPVFGKQRAFGRQNQQQVAE